MSDYGLGTYGGLDPVTSSYTGTYGGVGYAPPPSGPGTGIIERNPVTVALRTTLRGSLGVNNKIEVGEAPRDIIHDAKGQLTHPYAVITPWPSMVLYGSLELPDSGAKLTYQVTSVGRTDDSAQILADRIRRILLERLANGSFRYAITPLASVVVINRAPRDIGLVTPVSGLWNVHDVYDLEVEANG